MRLRSAHLLAIAALSAALGCGGDPGSPDAADGPADAGPDTNSAAFTVAEPDIPWLEDGVPPIQMTPCAEGWREVTERDVTVCDPYPEGGAHECEAGEAHFPGEPGCRPVGDPCPPGDYAAALPADGPILYVNPSAAPGGDGSMALPYVALSDVGWTALAATTTVALAKGTFPGAMTLNPGVRLMGACALETVLTGQPPLPGSTTLPNAVVRVREGGAAAVLQNLTIANPPQWGAEVRRRGVLEVRGVIFDHNLDSSIFAQHEGTTVVLSDAVIRGTIRDSDYAGSGIYAGEGAHIDATRTLFIDNHDTGALLQGPGTQLTLRDSVVRDTVSNASSAATGLYLTDGPKLVLERTVVSGEGDGVWATGRGTVASITDSVFVGTDDGTGSASSTAGVQARRVASADLTRVLLTGHASAAVAAVLSGASVTVTDSLIRGVERVTDEATGLHVDSGGRMDVARVLLEDIGGSAVVSLGEGSFLSLTDMAIRDSRPPTSLRSGGRGVSVWRGARLEAERLLVTRAYDAGIIVARTGSYVRVTDVVVDDTLASSMTGLGGRGVNVQEGARFDGQRVRVTESHGLGVVGLRAGTSIALTDTTVRHTMPRTHDNALGDGIAMGDDSALEGLRVLVDGAFQTGISGSTGATMNLHDVAIARVQATACEGDDCAGGEAGFGLASVGATLRLSSFSVAGSETCGVFVAPSPRGGIPPSVDLDSGQISGSLIGACVQVDGYDLGRLSNEVRYFDNETSLASTSLAIPIPPGALGSEAP